MNFTFGVVSHVVAAPPPSEAREVTKEVMTRELERSKSLWQRIVEWLAGLVPDPPSGSLGGSGGAVVPQLLVWVVVALIVAVLVWIVVRSFRGRAPRRKRRRDDDPVTESRTRTVAEWDDDSVEAAGAGDHRGAVRAAYRGMVAAIDAHSASSLRPGMTPAEILDHAAERWANVGSSIADATDCFERIWYAGRPAGAADVTRIRESAAIVRAAVAAPSRRLKVHA